VVGAALIISAAVLLGFDTPRPESPWQVPLLTWLLGGIAVLVYCSALGRRMPESSCCNQVAAGSRPLQSGFYFIARAATGQDLD